MAGPRQSEVRIDEFCLQIKLRRRRWAGFDSDVGLCARAPGVWLVDVQRVLKQVEVDLRLVLVVQVRGLAPARPWERGIVGRTTFALNLGRERCAARFAGLVELETKLEAEQPGICRSASAARIASRTRWAGWPRVSVHRSMFVTEAPTARPDEAAVVPSGLPDRCANIKGSSGLSKIIGWL